PPGHPRRPRAAPSHVCLSAPHLAAESSQESLLHARQRRMIGVPCRTIPCSTAPLVSPRRASDSRRVATDIAGTIRGPLGEGGPGEAAGAAFGTTGLQPTVSF